ncbi:MAG: peptide deformylase [Patescibacteria group bacterium]|nr:peptide deformylase [Patescibacteria group bacterium]
MDPIVQSGDPVLRAHAVAVPRKDIASPKIQKLIATMRRALAREEYGVALAAPQLGQSVRMFVIAGKVFAEEDGGAVPAEPRSADAKQTTRSGAGTAPEDMVFINPEIIRLSRKKVEMSEGCLSVRGKYGTVLRHEKATIKALDEFGKEFTYHGAALLGHIFQHEVDHLNGILYTDKVLKLEEDDELTGARAKLNKKYGV